MTYLTSVADLKRHPEYRVFDCRTYLTDKNQGRSEYLGAHIPGAVHADLDKELSDPPGNRGRHPLPDADQFLTQVQSWGVRNDNLVVCYDQAGGAFAARLWWMFRWLGHPHVTVLDGGLAAWIAAGHSTESAIPDYPPSDFARKPALTLIKSADELLHGDHLLVDARELARFKGEVEPIDSVAGHIPGAVCAPFMENLVDGKFREPGALRERFDALGVRNDRATICYCGSGVTAAHNILAMLIAGFNEPALYPDSWSGWITDPDRLIET